ncbi:hypothetical protein AVEN_16163-1 [Araneus ventricosus]|uniref:CCHC-type domain-containing protein n=1 Tax=Araneus ventricosus TaxID=182803 RepID=A0A4Y2L0S8_ARAVE|nr:hypothetical protein AVEN_16163-1 [Araneus ventricosus]
MLQLCPKHDVQYPVSCPHTSQRSHICIQDSKKPVSCSLLSILVEEDGFEKDGFRVRFTEFIGIRQCRTCGAFGHTAKYCDDRDNPQICGNCSMLKTENHSYGVPKCKNCIMANEKLKRNWHTIHSVFYKGCESYLRQRDILVKRTNYGN